MLIPSYFTYIYDFRPQIEALRHVAFSTFKISGAARSTGPHVMRNQATHRRACNVQHGNLASIDTFRIVPIPRTCEGRRSLDPLECRQCQDLQSVRLTKKLAINHFDGQEGSKVKLLSSSLGQQGRAATMSGGVGMPSVSHPFCHAHMLHI